MSYLRLVEQHYGPDYLPSHFSRSPHSVPHGVTAVSLSISATEQMARCLSPDCFPDGLRAAVPRRKATFLAGRLCAEWAIQIQCPAIDEPFVARGAHGEPLWPHNCVGSVTHTDLAAHAIVEQTIGSGIVGIGIDSEAVVDNDGFEAIVGQCFCSRERDLISQQDAPKVAATIFFSVKEAFYKAVFETVRRFVDFNEVEIESICWATGTVTIKVKSNDLTVATDSVPARFAITNGEVHASVFLYAMNCPKSTACRKGKG